MERALDAIVERPEHDELHLLIGRSESPSVDGLD